MKIVVMKFGGTSLADVNLIKSAASKIKQEYNKGKSAYAEERYSKEARRLYSVMDKRLGQHQYMSGKEYSIADISIWPWTARFDWQEIDLSEYKNVTRWYEVYKKYW